MTAVETAAPRLERRLGVRLDRWELAGAVADVGVLVPIAVALIVKNGLSPTAVLLPAGLLYLGAAAAYRLPVPVQPLKAFGAIAIAEGLGVAEIAAGGLLMGAVFVTLGLSGAIDAVARFFPKPLIRGVQLTVGLLFLKIAWGLVADPPASFDAHGLGSPAMVALAAGVLALLLLRRRFPVTLGLLAAAALAIAWTAGGHAALGPSELGAPALDAAAFWTAFTVLVLPQVPLSFANSCLATADAARTYFGDRAFRVTPGRLATTLGLANLFGGAVGGMPVCHGAGGLTAHHANGARTAGAPLAMGSALVALALLAGAGLGGLLAAFPLPILAGLLAGAGLLHIGLLRDLRDARALAFAAAVGIVGFELNLAVALAAGLAAWWGAVAVRRILPVRRSR